MSLRTTGVCGRTVVGEIQRADGGDPGEELLDYGSSRRPQLARKQETHKGERRRVEIGRRKKQKTSAQAGIQIT